MQASPVMDEKAFAMDVENAFQTMWTNWVDSSPADLLSERNH
jgi:predicted O-linked N-acetylglucosamine transferase (SPINDLY family)